MTLERRPILSLIFTYFDSVLQNFCLLHYGLYLHTFNSRAGFIRGYKRWNTTQWNTLWEGNNAANFVYIVLIAWLPVCLLFLFAIDGQFSTCFVSFPDVQWIVLLNIIRCFQDQGYALAADGPTFHTLEGLLRHYHESTTTLQQLTRPYNDKP